MSTHTPSEDVQPVKIVICENRLEFARSEGMAGVDREVLHSLLDEWFDHQVREAWRMSIKTKVL